MSKLHELLAVESELNSVAAKEVDAVERVFVNFPQALQAFVRTLEYLEDDQADADAFKEQKAMQTTTTSLLKDVNLRLRKAYDLNFAKDAANQLAKADIVIDDEVILRDVPATFLLSLETKLASLRKLYTQIPVLDPAVEWELDESFADNVYKAKHAEKAAKTAKTFAHRVLYEATEHHPAQIEKWEETKTVGIYKKEKWSSMMRMSDKNKLVRKLDLLIEAVKQARQRANCVEVNQADYSTQALFDFMFK